MATLTINDKAYDISKLSKEAKAQVGNLRFVDSEIARLNATVAVLQTARLAYANALKQALTPAPNVLAGDTMKLN